MEKYQIYMCDCEQCQAGRGFFIHVYKGSERLVSFASNPDCYHFRLAWGGNRHVITIPESEDELIDAFAALVRNKLVDQEENGT